MLGLLGLRCARLFVCVSCLFTWNCFIASYLAVLVCGVWYGIRRWVGLLCLLLCYLFMFCAGWYVTLFWCIGMVGLLRFGGLFGVALFNGVFLLVGDLLFVYISLVLVALFAYVYVFILF